MTICRRALVVAALAGLVGVSLPAKAAIGVDEYDPSTQTLSLLLGSGLVPAMYEASNPPRLVVDLAGVDTVEPHGRAFPTGLVARYDVARTTTGTRITLTLRRALHGAYRVGFSGERLQITLTPPPPPMVIRPPLPKPIEPPEMPAAPPVTVYASFPPVVVYPTPYWPGEPTPRPHARPLATPGVVRPRATPTPVPMSETPVPATPAPLVVPSAAATPVPMPVPFAQITPEPLASVTPPLAPPADAVFGSRFTLGGALPLALTQVYPLGKVNAEVDTVPAGNLAWSALFTPNFGLTIETQAVGYTLSDQEASVRGFTVLHRRDDYQAEIGIFGRQALPLGFEVMARPAVLVRTVQASSQGGVTGGDLKGLAENDYLSTGWLGVGGAVEGGLGWRIFGPLSIAATGDFGYLSGGKMFGLGVPSVFPMLSYRACGELRLDFGSLGFSAGYELGHDGHTGSASGDDPETDWSGPTAGLAWLF